MAFYEREHREGYVPNGGADGVAGRPRIKSRYRIENCRDGIEE